MSDFDSELIELITDATDGASISLSSLVARYGTALVERVIADGFCGIFLATNRADQPTPPTFLTTEAALALLAQSPVPAGYRVHQGWGIELEDEPTLIFRYAADDPAAAIEIRRLNAERRQGWERRCR